LRASAWRHVATAVVATGVGAVGLQAALGFGAVYVIVALVVASGGAAAILRYLPQMHPHRSFGPANAVTLARAVPTALVAALVVEAGTVAAAAFATVAGTAVVVLDGVDGRLARRHGVASEFGARFDMETDALLVLALAVLAWRWDRAGAWVVLSGLARYVFVAAAVVAPWLRRPLPASRRRQAVCVVQIVVLLVVIAPLLPRAVTAPLALAGLLVLVYSFAVDVAWLARRARLPLAREVP
jgi:phosphatidylglycerophosphate synthase